MKTLVYKSKWLEQLKVKELLRMHGLSFEYESSIENLIYKVSEAIENVLVIVPSITDDDHGGELLSNLVYEDLNQAAI